MSVRINLEIGHEASLRTKRTPEGFTHDWEVFVRGCEGANIQYYVEKVVFYLHETFPKPKRVIKEPPYSVKESGYAGFTLPIEIHLRNKDESKKLLFNYDLNLQPTGPPIVKLQKEKYIINAPNEEFKSKLLKGGGVVVNTSNLQELSRDSHPMSEEKSQLISKPRLTGSDLIKKHKPKIEEPRILDSFQDLFGEPITKSSKISPETKAIPKDKNSNINKSEKSSDKDKSKSKHSPHKDKEKDRDKARDKSEADKKIKNDKKRDEKKERSKDREERSKDKKERRERSPKAKSPSPKRANSPPKIREEKKVDVPKEKKNSEDRIKQEKKAKKEKRDKDKERKDSKHKDKDQPKLVEKENKNSNKDKSREIPVEKELSPPSLKVEKKDKPNKEKDAPKEPIKDTKELERIEKNGKLKADKPDEKQKHKHKKKDKDKKERSEIKDKAHKSEKKVDKTPNSTISKSVPNNAKDSLRENDKINLPSSPKNVSPNEVKNSEKPKKPLKALYAEYDDDSSSNSLSSHEDLSDPIFKTDLKKESPEPTPPLKLETKVEPLIPKLEGKDVKVKKEKTKRSKEKKAGKETEKKRKRKADTKREEEPMEKVAKEDSSNSNFRDSDLEQTVAPTTQVNSVNSQSSEDYMNILRDLQHKIMSLQDNSELQKVVQLIAETGRFEISARTFDFDLCLLERSTIKQLQDFFERASS